MSVRIIFRNKIYEVEPGMALGSALEILGVEPEAVLAVRGGEMISAECILKEGDEVRLVGVIGGG